MMFEQYTLVNVYMYVYRDWYPISELTKLPSVLSVFAAAITHQNTQKPKHYEHTHKEQQQRQKKKFCLKE